MVLYVNACVREESRTRRLADFLLNQLGLPVTELRLAECSFSLVDEAFLNRREQRIREGAFDDPMFDLARQFSEADIIVIAAPFWDLSFPAILKQYFEQISVTGITFRYAEDGVPVGLCHADRLYYITTAGGSFLPEAFGHGYVKALAESFYGIRNVEWIKATGLDMEGADVEQILSAVEEEIRRQYGKQDARIGTSAEAGGTFY